MRPIRVMHLRREVSTGGGPESLIVDISRHIDRGRFDLCVTLFGPPAAGPGYTTPLLEALHATGTRTLLLPARHRWDPAPIRTLARLLAEHQIDVLHSHDHRSNLIAYLATRLRRTLQVATLHQPLRRYWWIRHWELVDERVVSRFARVLPVAEAVRAEFVGKFPQVAERTITILNGVDTTRFTLDASPGNIRREFGIPPDAVLCVTVGRLMEDKNLPCLLDAARRVLDRRRDVYWLLAGSGPAEAELRARSAALGLNDHVLFAGFRSEVPAIMATADMLVVSSVSEGCCVAILEAMACGRPVVATRVGGTPEIVEDGQTGLIVEPRRADQLAEAMLVLAGAPQHRSALGQAGARRARELFSVERMVRRIEEVYTGLIDQNSCVTKAARLSG